MRCAKYETPSTSEPKIKLIITRVRFALTDSGVLKSPTPSAIASRPVRDDPPFANARSKINMAAAESRPCSVPISIAPGARGSS